MAHKLHIDKETRRASMMFVGKSPWHGLGTKLDKPATAQEAIVAASLGWNVTKRPLFTTTESGLPIMVKDRYAITREDSPATVLGVVGREYTPLQNVAAFSFFDPIVGKGAAVYHTAGVIGEGERVWILAKLPDNIQVIGDDMTHKYLLLSNSHDGESSVQIKFTPVRVVCNNTLTMALSHGPTINVRHLSDMEKRLREAEKMLGLIHKRFDEIGDAFKRMTKVQIDAKKLKEYFGLVFPDPGERSIDESRRARLLEKARENRGWAEVLFEGGAGIDIPGVRGTLWAAYNGVTQLIDHGESGLASRGHLDTIWFGQGYLTKARAFTLAEERMKVWQN
jgi:phage/plasmid-like protein (TIGR03299 family)